MATRVDVEEEEGRSGLSVCANSPINVNLQRQLVSYVGERIPLLTQSYLGFRSLCLSVSSYEWPVRGREKEKNEFIWERRMWTKVLWQIYGWLECNHEAIPGRRRPRPSNGTDSFDTPPRTMEGQLCECPGDRCRLWIAQWPLCECPLTCSGVNWFWFLLDVFIVAAGVAEAMVVLLIGRGSVSSGRNFLGTIGTELRSDYFGNNESF